MGDTISRADMQACLEDSGQVALVRVTQARVVGAGTRSERAAIDAVVENMLYGGLPEQVELGRYTSGGDALMEDGRRYIVAVNAVSVFPADYLITGFAAVPDGQVEEALEAHRHLIAELGD